MSNYQKSVKWIIKIISVTTLCSFQVKTYISHYTYLINLSLLLIFFHGKNWIFQNCLLDNHWFMVKKHVFHNTFRGQWIALTITWYWHEKEIKYQFALFVAYQHKKTPQILSFIKCCINMLCIRIFQAIGL